MQFEKLFRSILNVVMDSPLCERIEKHIEYYDRK